VRTFFRAAIACVLAAASFVGPVSAATTQHVTVAQASQQTGTLSGRVLGSTGYPLSGAAVTIQGSGTTKTAKTGSDGAFSVSLPPGLYTVTVNHGGYQTASNDVAVTSGQSIAVSIQLSESTLSNLQTIGRTSTTSAGNTGAQFNIGSSEVNTLSQTQITERDTPNLAPELNEMPGINIKHSTSNPNQYVYDHGFTYETKEQLDGHPVSSGTAGTFLTQFMQAGIFGGVDVSEGMGLNGPTAGESGIATVNLRTPDFTAKDSAFLNGGLDSYNGGFLNLVVDKNFGPNNRISLILGRSDLGYAGPTFGYTANDLTGATVAATGTNSPPYLTNDLIEYQSDFSNSYNLTADLAKIRYKFSEATSLTAEYIGFYGRWDPQGGAYGQFYGFGTVPQCLNTVGTSTSYTAAGSGAACTNLSEYNAPSAQNLVGQTNVPYYGYYPGSDVRQTQPNFNAEFKTSYKNDTILFRPYAATIRRLIDGSNESDTPGDASGWFEVTNPANCTVQYTGPSAANGGAKGPCYLANEAAYGPGYVTNPTVPHTFTTAPINDLPAGSCTPTNPCYTTSTATNNGGFYGFGSPYTTLEIDKLAGYTFSYIHPVGANIFNVSYDHYYDDSQAFINDASPIEPGCTFTISGGAPVASSSLGYQSTCGLPSYKPSPISVPETFSSIGSLAATAQIQLLDKLEFDFGNYFTHYVINAQQISPSLIAAYSAPGAVYTICTKATLALCPAGTTLVGGAFHTPVASPLAYIPVDSTSLVGVQNTASHYDPHFGFVFRPTRDLAIRLNAGSSTSIPYASQVSGFQTRAQSTISTTITTPNAELLPEEIVAEDFGLDYRLHNGTIFSGDVFNIIDHNPWISSKQQIGASCGTSYGTYENCGAGAPLYLSQQLNGSQLNSQGVDLTLANEPRVGFGYRVTGTLDRAYYLNQPPALFATAGQSYYNGAQEPQIPYTKGYAEVQYAGVGNTLLRLGMDYEGPNNEYNAPAFVVFDAGIRIGLSHGVYFSLSGENITNVNFDSQLAAGVINQGTYPLLGTGTATGYSYSVLPTGSSALTGTGLVQPGFRTFRFALTKRL
jgi:hypothetical protein